jgi:hypothetical protein
MGLLDGTVALNGFANVVTEGLLAGLNTASATAGDPVWLGTSGNLIYGLANKPSSPAHLVFIGIVTKANASTGEIFVRVQNGFELREIHDVSITSPANGQVLKYNGTTGLWENGLGATTLDDLTDVTITTPSSGQALVYTGSQWANQIISTDPMNDSKFSAIILMDIGV